MIDQRLTDIVKDQFSKPTVGHEGNEPAIEIPMIKPKIDWVNLTKKGAAVLLGLLAIRGGAEFVMQTDTLSESRPYQVATAASLEAGVVNESNLVGDAVCLAVREAVENGVNNSLLSPAANPKELASDESCDRATKALIDTHDGAGNLLGKTIIGRVQRSAVDGFFVTAEELDAAHIKKP